MNIIKRFYSIYCIGVFLGLFTLLLPLFLLFIQNKAWHKQALRLNYIWAKAFFFLCMVRVKVEYQQRLDPKGQYIFCPNHFSYIDIPTMGLTPIPFKFVGKMSMAKVPVFGYMYSKLHILVDRGNIRSRYETLQKTIKALDEGLNLTIFPEGGIVSTTPPTMSRFKPGAFKAAVEKKVPIVPVTLCHNYLFLPDDGKFLPNHRDLKVIFHQPINTETYTSETIDRLNQKVFDIIAEELSRTNGQESRQEHFTENSTLSKA